MRNTNDHISQLLQTVEICDIHLKRLNYAAKKLDELFPLDKQSYQALKDADITVIDQMVYRFTKLQDTMGRKLFSETLLALGEDYSEQPFLDVLNRLEKLELIPDRQEWFKMREIRNQIAHEYPSETKMVVDALNSLYASIETISKYYTNLKDYLQRRFQE